MDYERGQRFADEWYAAWNAHDLDAILDHYTDDDSLILHYRGARADLATEVVFLDSERQGHR
jgi:ketosteroid isomerase-like protein